MIRTIVAVVAAAVAVAGCSISDEVRKDQRMDYIETPRDRDRTFENSVALLEEIRATVDRLKPGLVWRPVNKKETMYQCTVGEDERPGTFFRSGVRQTLYVPSEQEWEQWSSAIVELAGRHGFEAPSELPLGGGDHSLRLYTPEGDWLEVATFDTGGFSYRMSRICTPDPE